MSKKNSPNRTYDIPVDQNDSTPSRKSGFGSSDDKNLNHDSASKIGNSAGTTQNVLASSANISSSPDSTATGEDESPTESPARGRPISISVDPSENKHAAEPDEEDVYASESDELELARAVLEEATQSPGVKHDPSSAREEIEETDDLNRP